LRAHERIGNGNTTLLDGVFSGTPGRAQGAWGDVLEVRLALEEGTFDDAA